ncbi:ExeA family protein [Tundrisphaera sp. TA3]|uniref:ExeA family protein n=1 Tax=Tundrisphaera sp. TA3 TaxID=3435775 RepID=UPI003EBB8FAF
MWLRHWGLTRDPFGPLAHRNPSSFVATPSREEAVARLVHAIEAAHPSARLVAAPGLGKTTVLERAFQLARSPSRRVAVASGPIDGAGLIASLAEGLGVRVAPGAGRASAWRSLADAARLCRFQGLHVVLAVDDCQMLVDPADRLDLDRLDHVDPDPSARVSVIRVGRPDPDPDGMDRTPRWDLAIRLEAYTRSEAAAYLDARLAASGRPAPTFTPRAQARLHALSGGVPRGLDRLAHLALMAGALRGLEIITPDVVDASAHECDGVHAAVEFARWGDA